MEIHPCDSSSALNALLEADFEASQRGFPAIAVAPRKGALDELTTALLASGLDGKPVELECFKSITSWPDATLVSLYRTRLLVAYSTAEQLVPARLGELLERAGQLQLPVLFYVSRMGRIGEPEALIETFRRNIENTTRGSNSRVTCIDDPPRFTGPTLEEAIRSDLSAIDDPDQTRNHCLNRLLYIRRVEIREAVLRAMVELREKRSRFRFEQDTIKSAEKGQQVLARAEASADASCMKSLEELLVNSDTESWWSEIRNSAGEHSSLIEAYRTVVLRRVSEALEKGREGVEIKLAKRHENLLKSLSVDVARSKSELELLLSDSIKLKGNDANTAIKSLDLDQQQTLDLTMDRCLQAISGSIDNTIIKLIDILRNHASFPSFTSTDDETDETKEGVNEEAEENTDKQERGESKNWQKRIIQLRGVLDPWFEKTQETLLRPQLEKDIETSQDIIREETSRAVNRWIELLSDHVSHAFSGLVRAIETERAILEQHLEQLRNLESDLD